MENILDEPHDYPLLVLASTSPRRQELIHTLQLPVEVEPSNEDETVDIHWAPYETVEQLALRKANSVARARRARGEGGLVIGADTIVVLRDTILGKPENEADAFRMLSALQNEVHEVYTGVAIIDALTGVELVRHRKTAVWMRPLNPEQITRYIASGEPMDKAGSYGIQGLGAALVDRIEGCYFNVVGLPISLLADMLKVYGIEKP
ncbi:Maf family protein [Paenibacillus agilis]|uniref:dTTP/UTP pyrophosphatase n=1 Tax=Paenibacillus agilis TaxID=3020863 RepID=A0A559IHV0_9BACL|nr:Maf family protein [Paenibacillus agilis]TVX87252.1 septum formation protein Maf [Paenibacillus agilis]